MLTFSVADLLGDVCKYIPITICLSDLSCSNGNIKI